MGEVSHRFAAIMAADVDCFSARMEGDAEVTVRALQDCRQLFNECVTKHGGREFGSVGDSFMAEFPSPVEALRAARDFQAVEHLQVRVGLHAGDVVVDGDDIFGDVVNTAARLQQLAQPGGITLSGFIHYQVRKEPGFQFRSLGKRSLKNIAEPVSVFEVSREQQSFNWRRVKLALLPYRVAIAALVGVVGAGALIIAYLEVRETPRIGATVRVPMVDSQSVAVLPFVAMTADEDDEYFAAGLSEEVRNSLATIDGLRVAGRFASESLNEQAADLREVGTALNVAHVLEGSVRSAAGRRRITAQLTQVSDGHLLWSSAYGHDSDDIFTIQTDIASQVASALRVTLLAEQVEALAEFGTRNAEARSAFLVAKARLHRDVSYVAPSRDYQHIRRTRELLEEIVELDPGYADAWALLARAVLKERSVSWGAAEVVPSTAEVIDRAVNAVETAERLNPEAPELVLAKADLAYWIYHFDPGKPGGRDRATAAYREAVAARPNDVDVLESAASYYHWNDMVEPAMALYDRILQLEPRPAVRLSRAMLLAETDTAAGYREMATVGELHPESTWRESLAYLEAHLGHYHHALAIGDEHPETGHLRQFMWASLGDTERALQDVERIRPATGYSNYIFDCWAFRIRRDYEGLRNWLATERVTAAVPDGVRRCVFGFQAAYMLRDWREAERIIDACLQRASDDASDELRGTPRGRELLRPRSIDIRLVTALKTGRLAYVFQQSGRQEEARHQWQWAEELLDTTAPVLRRQKLNAMHYRALIQAGQGQVDAALDTLESLYEAGWRGPLMGWLDLVAPAAGDRGWFEDNPMLDSIRDEPRFITFASRLKADNARMLEEYRAGLTVEDIIRDDLERLAR